MESIIIIKDSEAIKGKMMDEVSGETSYSRNNFNSLFFSRNIIISLLPDTGREKENIIPYNST